MGTELLVSYIAACSPTLVAIDAPLSVPSKGALRQVEREARRLGLRLLPPLMGAMRELTSIGVSIRRVLEGRGIRVIEVHPSSTLRLAKVPIDKVVRWANRSLSEDQLDSIVAALTGLAYLLGNYIVIGGELVVARTLPCV